MNVATDLSLQAASLEAVVSDLSAVFQVDGNSPQITGSLKFARSLALKVSASEDLIGNRVKRFFSDNLTFLKSARVGLGPNLSVPIFVRGQRFGAVVVCWLDPS